MNAARALLLALALPACGPVAPDSRAPSVGNEGKDVVYLPTSQALVETMLDLAQVGPRDRVIDLGSGDGRTVIAAARRGAQALGIEYNGDLVALSRHNARAAGVEGKARFVQADLFRTDLSQATVITMFLLPSINLKLRPALLELKPGTRIVSNTFTMDTWQPDGRVVLDSRKDECGPYCTALLWIVPARVAGTYALPEGELRLEQRFQVLSGTLRSGALEHEVEGRVRGAEVEFSAGGREYRGRAKDGRLELR